MLTKPPGNITLQDIQSRYSYDPETGKLTWAKTFQTNGGKYINIGDQAGRYKGAQYQITVRGHTLNGRRVAWWIMTGAWPTKQIITANGDPRDLRWANLAYCVDVTVERRLQQQAERQEQLAARRADLCKCLECGAQLGDFRSHGICDDCRRLRKMALRLSKLYGLTPADILAMLEAQGFVCAICNEAPEGGPVVDHDHSTGAVRGILCSPCNTGLGHFRDDAARLLRASEYLRTA